MKEQNFEKKLKRSLHQSPPMRNEKHFENTLLLARKEAYQKQKRERISFTRFLSMQIKFIGWKIWSVQGIFLAAISCILSRSYDYIKNPQHMTKLLFCLSVLVFMTALPFVYRSVRYQMQEIEAVTRFSSVKLLMAKLIVIGIGDVSILSGILFTTVIKTSLQIDSAILYLSFPFLLVCSSSLFMLGHFTTKQFFVGSMGLCSFLVLVLFVIPRHYGLLFQQSFSAGWIMICALLTAFCIQQFRYILYYSSYTEMQVT